MVEAVSGNNLQRVLASETPRQVDRHIELAATEVDLLLNVAAGRWVRTSGEGSSELTV